MPPRGPPSGPSHRVSDFLTGLLARATQDTPREMDRLRRRLALSGGAAPAARDLGQLPDATSEETARLRWRVLRAPITSGRRARRRVALAGIALAALLLGLRIGLRPRPLHQVLLAPQPEELALTRHVALTYQGSGLASGSVERADIQWEMGVLEVQVEPGRGTQLVVRTAEARVVVVGTAFRVTRDSLGTAVEVERGQVELRCEGAGERLLAAGEAASCLPARAAGLLVRARALAARGSVVAALGSVEEGLVRAAVGDPIRGELLALQAQLLLELERPAEAARAARAYLAEGHEFRAAQLEELLRALPEDEGQGEEGP